MVCPAFADSISEGDIRWEKAVGDSVTEDEVLCEIETDKTSVPSPSPGSLVQESPQSCWLRMAAQFSLELNFSRFSWVLQGWFPAGGWVGSGALRARSRQ